jgi:2'-hydroxyisoflavone reductase
MHTRRNFMATTLAAAGAVALSPRPSWAAPRSILILGGTGFVGPHQVRRAIERGHKVTIFNRGRTAPGMFGKDVEELAGDRAGNLDILKGRKWDAVIDESASTGDAPEWVKQSATVLRDSTDQYLFISTRAVYLDYTRVPMTAAAPVVTRENSPVGPGPLPYGHAKAYAEKEAQRILPGRVTVVRPAIIIGPGDDTDRFTYWPVRVARGGAMMAPGDGSDHVQLIDVRDLVDFNIKLVEDRTFGVFNALGPQMGQPFKDLLERVQRGVGGSASVIWIEEEFLRANGGLGFPGLSIHQVMRGRTAGYSRFDVTPELKAGMTFRPTEVSARDTLEWFRTLPADGQAGLLRGLEREAQLLAAWKARAGRGV